MTGSCLRNTNRLIKSIRFNNESIQRSGNIKINKYILGDKNRAEIVFATDNDRIWPERFWQMVCLSGEKRLIPTKRSEGPAIISCSQGRYEADDFRFINHNFNAQDARLEWETANGNLRLQAQWRYDPETAVLNRCDRLINTGKDTITIFRCLPRFAFPPNNYEIYFQRSRWSNENQGEWLKLHAGSITLVSEWGRSTEGVHALPVPARTERAERSGLPHYPAGQLDYSRNRKNPFKSSADCGY